MFPKRPNAPREEKQDFALTDPRSVRSRAPRQRTDMLDKFPHQGRQARTIQRFAEIVESFITKLHGKISQVDDFVTPFRKLASRILHQTTQHGKIWVRG